jgi:aspartate aminotransferase
MKVAVSATLAANEAIAKRRSQGLPVLPMGFGEAGLPVPNVLREKLSEGAGKNGYGPVAGSAELCEAIAGYWNRRDITTDASRIVCGPGSKPLLYGLIMAIGGDVAIAAPSWVSYAVQAKLLGVEPLLIPTLPGQGGVPNPELLAKAVDEARLNGRVVRSAIVTLPDNPTGTLAGRETVTKLCEVAESRDLIIISDEIYRDLVFDPESELVSPVTIAPQRTVVTTGLSKNLALGGWRLGAARLPEGARGDELLAQLKGIASEIWSSPSAPIQHAAAYAFSEPPEIISHIAASRRLHGLMSRAVAERFRAAGVEVPEPKGAFYLYPDFENWREQIKRDYGITTGASLSDLFLHEYGLGVLPANEFGEAPEALRLRVAVSLLYGETEAERRQALEAENSLALPWIQNSLNRLEAILSAVSSPVVETVTTTEYQHDEISSPVSH